MGRYIVLKLRKEMCVSKDQESNNGFEGRCRQTPRKDNTFCRLGKLPLALVFKISISRSGLISHRG